MPTILTQFSTIREIHDALDKKSMSVVELTQELLSAAEISNLGAVLTLCEDRSLSQARQMDTVLASEGKVPRDRMPLFGIPIGIKDLMCIEGVRTTAGSKILENYLPPYTATAVEKLELAGAVTVAKLNLDEFAMGSSNENSAFGPVSHPTHPGRVPGGSSGGSAAAVKSGLCLAALGTDTGGSIRLPASYCGIVGIKPTYGRVSRFGQIAYASSLDQMGPMANTVEDAAIMLDAMSGFDPLDSTSSPVAAAHGLKSCQTKPDWKNLRIGIPKEYFIGGIAPDVEKSIQDSLRWFESQGASLVEISLPHTSYAVAVYYLVAVSEASSNLARFDGVRFGPRPFGTEDAKDLAQFYERVRASFGPEVKRRILLGTFALSSGYSEAYYKRACQVRRKIKQDFDAAFQRVNVIMSPVAPTTAFKVGEKSADPLQMYLNDIFTIPANLAGLPAMSVPCGQDQQGLPVGLHIMAPPFGEDHMISIAHSFFSRTEGGR